MRDTENNSTLSEPILNENAVIVLKERYLKKNKDGEPIESPKDMFIRVTNAIAQAEKLYKNNKETPDSIFPVFYNLLAEGYFLPNSPTLMNAGRSNGMLSACFVLPVGDSIDDIFTSVKNTAMIQKAGGGTGFSFNRLRPSGDIVNSSGTTTSGPLPFIKVFSEATNAIQQGAFRRGANMGIMNVDHPDIIQFIKIKENLTQLTNFNLSVAITEKFMEDFYENKNKEHTFINPRTNEEFYVAKQDGKNWTVGDIFNEIIQHAWKSGEPGVVFIDRMNASNPVPHVGKIEATNPCGEQPLLPYESCNLGSINIKKFIKSTKDGSYFDFDHFKDVIKKATRFLDNVIDINQYPIPEITEITRANRKIGLGIMGFADALFALGIQYDSEDGLNFANKIMQFLSDESHKASIELAEERGVFPNWKGSVWEQKKIKIRNACTTTIAPTGTISIIANCSGGIEPIFSLAFERNILGGKKLLEINPVFKERLEADGLFREDIIQEILSKGSLKDIPNLPLDIKKIFVTARDISPENHVKMQSAFQNHCDASISKTINLPNEASVTDVENTFLLAYETNCKGITVYRDGCRMNQPMSLKKKEEKNDETPEIPKIVKPIPVPDIMSAVRVRQITPFGNMHIKIVVDAATKQEREVFAQLGKGGEIASSDLEAICRMISMYLRVNGSLDDVIKQLDGIGTSLTIPTKDGRIMSLADGLAKGLKKYKSAKDNALLFGEIENKITLDKSKESEKSDKQNKQFSIKCPDCQYELSFEEGCSKCHACGYSQC